MRLTDEERAALERTQHSQWYDIEHPPELDAVAEAIGRILARDSERTMPVTAEWLDGPEGKRLGFERDVHDEWLWIAKADGLSSASVQLSFPGPALWVGDWCGVEAIVDRQLHGDATIAQVRDAVRLFTGRE